MGAEQLSPTRLRAKGFQFLNLSDDCAGRQEYKDAAEFAAIATAYFTAAIAAQTNNSI